MAMTLRDLAGGADRFVVIDTEATGIYSHDRIVEIAIITLSLRGEVIDVFETLVQPECDVTAGRIHRITPSMVIDAPTFPEIAGDVASRLRGAGMVAHNAWFDFRMLRSEFRRIGNDITAPTFIDTLEATRTRLAHACSIHGIQLDNWHSAMADAAATAELFLAVAGSCTPGTPIDVDGNFPRSGRARRRSDASAVQLEDPPLFVYLDTRLSPDEAELHELQYLDALGRALIDFRVSPEEAQELARLATELGLSEADVLALHRWLLHDLLGDAIANRVVSDGEYESLLQAAMHLGLSADEVQSRVHPFRVAVDNLALTEGLRVAVTGEHPVLSKTEVRQALTAIGCRVQKELYPDTAVLAAVDPATNAVKAARARKNGIPIVALDDLLGAQLGSMIPVHHQTDRVLHPVTCPACRTVTNVVTTENPRHFRLCPACLLNQ